MNWWIDDHPRSYGNINPVTWPCAHSADWKTLNPLVNQHIPPMKIHWGIPHVHTHQEQVIKTIPTVGSSQSRRGRFFLVTYTFQVSADWSHTPNIIRSLQWSWVQLYKHQQSQPVEMHCFYILRKSKYILCVYIYISIYCVYIYTHNMHNAHIAQTL